MVDSPWLMNITMDYRPWTMDYDQKKSPDRHRGRLLYNAHEKKNKVDIAKLTA